MKKPLEGGWVHNPGMYRVLLLVVLLAGCSQAAERDARADRKAMRLQAAKEAAAQPPKRTVYRFDNGELVVLDIATIVDGGFGDTQKCFLWRDAEFKSATLQCPANATADLPDIQ